MSALRIMSFTSTLHLTRDRMLEKQTRRRAVATRISCCNPTSAGVDKVACKQQQAHEDTLHSRPVAAKAASTATDDASTTQNMTKLLGEIHAESEWDAYCDVLPDSRVCQQEELLQYLTPSSPISDLEEETCEFECVARGSKKPQRLSFTSWDLLD